MLGEREHVWRYRAWEGALADLARRDERVRPVSGIPFVVVTELPARGDPPVGVEVVGEVRASDLALAEAIARVGREVAARNAAVRQVDEVAVPEAFPGALNISLQRRPGPPPGHGTPVAWAVDTVRQAMPIVVAAGNWGSIRDAGGDARSALARLPGVVSVAATVDEVGTALVESNGAGPVGGDGPTVCAYGENHFVRGVLESSFAAPVNGQ